MYLRYLNKISVTILLMTLAALCSASRVIADTTGPEAVAEQFAAALQNGETATVRGLLAKDVLIFESGGAETSLEEYAGHHLPADIKFMSAVQREVLSRTFFDFGEQAVVATRSRLSGSHNGQAVDLSSTETLVMRRGAEGWKIVHVHWSSR